jgi:hypothetical protein
LSKSKKIKVMLSSRCNDGFPAPVTEGGQALSEIRRKLKQKIEAQTLFGRKVFDVWINEDAPPEDGTNDSWETCIKEVRDCDILIVLFNGNAGWAKTGGQIGICHMEYMEGLNCARGKVRFIALPNTAGTKNADGERNKRFQEYVQEQTPFRGGEVRNIDELEKRVFEALSESIVTLAQRGVASAASSRFDMGAALNWTRLDFRQRKAEMERVLKEALQAYPDARVEQGVLIVPIGGKKVAVLIHAIPAAFTVSAARELVGRPFQQDHERIEALKNSHGPIHIIACHRTATESQAASMLGFPDATVVSGPFGVYVSDDIQKVQFVFLVNCRDESQTRHSLQRFIEWLDQTGEAAVLARRAVSRAKIVKVIASEVNKT